MDQKIKIFVLAAMLIFFGKIKAQPIVRTGLIRTSFTISPSYVFSTEEGDFHFHGTAEVFVAPRFSVVGDGYFFLGKLSGGASIFDYNHSIFWGGNFHWVRNNSDFYVGVQPGITITKLDTERNGLTSSRQGTNPVFSGVIGFNQYISSNFHFFLQSRIVLGNHAYDKQMNLNELKLSAGLGFNLNAKK